MMFEWLMRYATQFGKEFPLHLLPTRVNTPSGRWLWTVAAGESHIQNLRKRNL